MMEKTYSKNPNIVFRKIASEFILVPVRQKAADLNCIYLLNEIGSAVWGFIDGTKNLKEIAEMLIEIYDVEQGTLQSDLQYFFGQLMQIEAVQEKTTDA